MNSVNFENDITNCKELYNSRELNEEFMIECLYPVDAITSMYVLILCNENLKSKTKKTGRNLIKAAANTIQGQKHQNVTMFMYCLLHDNCSELMLKSLKQLNMTAEQAMTALAVCAWSRAYAPTKDLVTDEVIEKLFEKVGGREPAFLDMPNIVRPLCMPRRLLKNGLQII